MRSCEAMRAPSSFAKQYLGPCSMTTTFAALAIVALAAGAVPDDRFGVAGPMRSDSAMRDARGPQTDDAEKSLATNRFQTAKHHLAMIHCLFSASRIDRTCKNGLLTPPPSRALFVAPRSPRDLGTRARRVLDRHDIFNPLPLDDA